MNTLFLSCDSKITNTSINLLHWASRAHLFLKLHCSLMKNDSYQIDQHLIQIYLSMSSLVSNTMLNIFGIMESANF